MRTLVIALCCLFGCAVSGAFAQSVANVIDTGLPTLDPDDITPAAGTVTNERRVVFSGTTTDTAGTDTRESISGIDRVEYRLPGYRRWRRATLTARGETTTQFFFTVKIRKGRGQTVFIRVRDRKGNESDVIGRKVTHSKVRIIRSAETDSGTADPPAVEVPVGGN